MVSGEPQAKTHLLAISVCLFSHVFTVKAHSTLTAGSCQTDIIRERWEVHFSDYLFFYFFLWIDLHERVFHTKTDFMSTLIIYNWP